MLNAIYQRVQQNVSSLNDIPAGLIDEAWREELIERALAKEEVYAYTSGLPPDMRWFVWDDSAILEGSMYPGVRYPLDELHGGRP